MFYNTNMLLEIRKVAKYHGCLTLCPGCYHALFSYYSVHIIMSLMHMLERQLRHQTIVSTQYCFIQS